MTARATRSLRTFDRNFAIFSKQTLHNSIMQPKLSKQDESEVTPELNSLIESGWKLDEEQIGVQKTYHFKTYTKVLDLHHIIGVRSKSKDHHPKMTTEMGSLTVYWSTHSPRGLSAKDTIMAKYCDEEAKTIGTVDQSDAQRCGPIQQRAIHTANPP